MKFSKVAAFRSVVEQYRSALWEQFSKSGHPGRTFIIKNSPWISEISEVEPEFSMLEKHIKHYVISTDIEIVEVLSRYEPVMTKVGA